MTTMAFQSCNSNFPNHTVDGPGFDIFKQKEWLTVREVMHGEPNVAFPDMTLKEWW